MNFLVNEKIPMIKNPNEKKLVRYILNFRSRKNSTKNPKKKQNKAAKNISILIRLIGTRKKEFTFSYMLIII